MQSSGEAQKLALQIASELDYGVVHKELHWVWWSIQGTTSVSLVKVRDTLMQVLMAISKNSLSAADVGSSCTTVWQSKMFAVIITTTSLGFMWFLYVFSSLSRGFRLET